MKAKSMTTKKEGKNHKRRKMKIKLEAKEYNAISSEFIFEN